MKLDHFMKSKSYLQILCFLAVSFSFICSTEPIFSQEKQISHKSRHGKLDSTRLVLESKDKLKKIQAYGSLRALMGVSFDGHVGVEILVRLLSKKTQLIIDIFTRTISLILFLLITWQMFLYAKEIHEVGEVSMNLEFPIYYIVYLLAFGLLIFSVTILETIFKTFKELKEL